MLTLPLLWPPPHRAPGKTQFVGSLPCAHAPSATNAQKKKARGVSAQATYSALDKLAARSPGPRLSPDR